jgi:large subunit ribosomal protein L29
VSKAREALGRIRDLPDDELGQALDRAREELFRLQLGNYTNQVENTISLRLKRRELARIMTVQRARDLDLESQSAGAADRRAADAEGAESDEPQTVADRARAAVGRPRKPAKPAKGSAKPAKASKSGAGQGKKKTSPTGQGTKKTSKASGGKAKAGAKTSKKKSGKE